MSKRIGFFSYSISHPMSQSIWNAVNSRIRLRNDKLIAFSGGYLPEKGTSPSPLNTLYELADSSYLDGIVMYGGSLGACTDLDTVVQFVGNYPDIPVVNIALTLPGIPSVSFNNYSGMYQLLEHLILEHKYRNIAVITGPDEHLESYERFRAYKDILKAHNIPYSDQLVVTGTFTTNAGRKGVDTILGERKLKPDVIVSWCDDIARGVLERLEEKGYLVPDDIAVTGFDNTPVSRAASPPITTVTIPFFQQGIEAVELLYQKMAGKNIPIEFTIDPSLVIRSSCGCSGSYLTIPLSDMSRNSVDGQGPEGIDSNTIIRLVELDQNMPKDRNSREWMVRMVHLLTRYLKDNARDTRGINSEIINSLQQFQIRELSLSHFHSVVSAIHNAVVAVFPIEDIVRLDVLFHQMRVALCSALERNELELRIERENLFGLLNFVRNQMSNANDLQTFKHRLKESVENLELKHTFLILQNESQGVQIFFSYPLLTVDSESSSSSLFWPIMTVLEQCQCDSLFIEPVLSGNEWIGYLIFEFPPAKITFSESLGQQISASLSRLFLMEDRNRRTVQLERSLANLQQTQEQLIEAEKMAALGGMVAGVAHEINNPIGISITASSFLADELQELFNGLVDQSLSDDDVTVFRKRLLRAADSVVKNLTRAAAMVEHFKNVAVDQSSEAYRTFFLREYLDEILSGLHNQIKKTGVQVDISCSSRLQITSYPGAIFQIVTNLILNSLAHGFAGISAKGREKLITIKAYRQQEHLTLQYSDSGKGMDSESLRRIFEPFYTTRRSGGSTGLGMHIVFNIVTQKLQGTITVRSSPGEGVEFRIIFPASTLQKK